MKHRIESLPKWAQELIAGLERRIDEREIDLSPGAEHTVQMTRKERKAFAMLYSTSFSHEVWRRLNSEGK